MTKVIKATSKGEITLPNSIRDRLGINNETYLAVDVIGDFVLMKMVDMKLKEISIPKGSKGQKDNKGGQRRSSKRDPRSGPTNRILDDTNILI